MRQAAPLSLLRDMDVEETELPPVMVLLPVVNPGDDPTVLAEPGFLLGSEPAVRVELSPDDMSKELF